MSKRELIGMWIWRVTYASLVAAVAAGFYYFWSEASLMAQPTGMIQAQASARTPAPNDCNCKLPSDTVAPIPEVSDDLADLDEQAGGDFLAEAEAAPPPPSSPKLSVEQVLAGRRAAAESQMFQARISGPYALSIRDNLNEMVIGTYLAAEGLGDQRLDRVLNSVPSLLPTHGYISSGFGERRSPFTRRRVHHNGVDFAVPRGSPVYATADGEVTYSGWFHGLGKMIMIDHGFGIVTRYGHNSALVAKVGDHVQRGEIVAKAGSTGRSTGSHVHYEVWINDHAIDPARFMFEVPGRDAPGEALAAGPHLGLAMGGDGSPEHLLRMMKPGADVDRSAGNVGILGMFVFAVLALAYAVMPKKEIPLRH